MEHEVHAGNRITDEVLARYIEILKNTLEGTGDYTFSKDVAFETVCREFGIQGVMTMAEYSRFGAPAYKIKREWEDEKRLQTMKVCTRCGEEKPRSEFSKNKTEKDGRQSWCKACYADYNAIRKMSTEENTEFVVDMPEEQTSTDIAEEIVIQYKATRFGVVTEFTLSSDFYEYKDSKMIYYTAEGKEIQGWQLETVLQLREKAIRSLRTFNINLEA